MTDATNRTGPDFVTPAGVILKDAAVDIHDINPVLQSFLITAGLVHLTLFDMPMVVTSGKDGVHSARSKHGTGNALDVRIKDKAGEDQAAFLLALRVLCKRFHLTVFDESNLPGEGHVHIEVAG